jgi:hypothetical protein
MIKIVKNEALISFEKKTAKNNQKINEKIFYEMKTIKSHQIFYELSYFD